jgi:KUP system potassium uptake protein
VQRFGTDKVGYLFAPVILLWLLLIGGVGVYNLVKHDVGVLRAFNPRYIVDYFCRNGKDGWVSLGGVLLCFTGTEALFADLGYFSIRSIQLSFAFGLVPAVLLAYIGQAAFLRHTRMRWPTPSTTPRPTPCSGPPSSSRWRRR